MPEELNSLSNDEQGGVVDQPASPNDFDIVEINPESSEDQPEAVDQDVEEPEKAEEAAPKKQTKEENHAAKAARLQAERAAEATRKSEIEKARKEAYAEFENRLKTSGVKNPYTEKNFESFEEFLDYGRKVTEAEQRERAESEGKTIEEIRQEDEDKAYLARKRQEDSEKADREKAENTMKEQVSRDLQDFTEKYPDVDVSNVVTNQAFKKFAGSRLGREPLADLYSDFTELVGTAESNGRAKAARGNRSTGSGDTGGDRMTAQQRKDLAEWNAAFPEMQMTAAEFLKR